MLEAKLLVNWTSTRHFLEHLCQGKVALVLGLCRAWLGVVHLAGQVVFLVSFFLHRYFFSQLIEGEVDAPKEIVARLVRSFANVLFYVTADSLLLDSEACQIVRLALS